MYLEDRVEALTERVRKLEWEVLELSPAMEEPCGEWSTDVAPEGERVLVVAGGEVSIAEYRGGVWHREGCGFDALFFPSHWMHLPKAP